MPIKKPDLAGKNRLAITVWDKDLRLVTYEDFGGDVLQYPARMLVQGAPFESFVRFHAERGEFGEGEIEEHVRQRVASVNRLEPHQFERTRADGVVLEIRSIPLPGGGFISTHTDITERRRTQDALRESEQRVRAIADSVPVVLSYIDTDHRIQFSNKTYEHWFGAAPGELIGKSLRETLGDEAYRQILPKIEGVLAGKEQVFEVDAAYKNAGRRFVLAHYVPHFDENRKVLGFNAAIIDISERKRAEDALGESEAKFRDLVETSQDLIWRLDREGRFTYLNPAWQTTLGYSPGEMLGQLFTSFKRPQEAERTLRTYRETLQGTSFNHYETSYISKSGKEISLNFKAKPLFDSSGKIVGTQGTATDITERKQAEEHFRGLAEGSIQGIIVHRDFKILFANQAMADLIGYGGVEEVLAMDLYEIPFDAPHERERVRNIAKARMRGEGPLSRYEAQAIKKDGTPFWLESLATVVTWQGEPAIQVTYTDITDRKRAEEELRASKRLLETVFDTIPFPVFVKNRESRSIMVNKANADSLGLDTGFFKNKATRDIPIGTEEEIARAYEQDRAVVEKGERVEVQEHLNIPSRGEPKLWHLIKVPLRDESGEIEGIVGMRWDITDRERAEKALRESEARTRKFINASPTILAYLGADGRYRQVNEGYLAFVGEPENKVIGHTIAEVIGPEIFELYRGHIEQVLAGQEVNFEISRPVRDLGLRILDVKFVPDQNDVGEVVGFFASVNDITDRKAMEAHFYQAQKMDAVGTLAGGIAHNFNNLLQMIMSNISLMLMETDSSDPQYETLAAIKSRVTSGAELTKQLLGFSGGGKYQVNPADLNMVLLRTSYLFGSAYMEISIHKELEPELWISNVDQNQIEQVLLNLFVNAQQAMARDGQLFLHSENVTVEESFAKLHDVAAGRYVKLSVTDTGVGMDQKTLSRIFEPFFTTKGMAQGTGLGLASAYGIIKNHDGIITVDSEMGRGTTFDIYLPASEDAVETGQPQKVDSRKSPGPLLFVDDDEDLVAVARLTLKKSFGYEVFTAKNGNEAIEIYSRKANEIALVILDLIMPEMGGGETFDRLRELNPKVKVLLSSGYSLEGEAAEIMARGCDGFIQKPFDLDALSGKILEVLDQK